VEQEHRQIWVQVKSWEQQHEKQQSPHRVCEEDLNGNRTLGCIIGM